MDAVSIYRVLLIVRGVWAVLEWFFGWGPQRLDSVTLLHPYAWLFAHAIAVAFWLLILTCLWFFQRWARLVFVFLFALAVLSLPFRAALRYFHALRAVWCYYVTDARDNCGDPDNVFSAADT